MGGPLGVATTSQLCVSRELRLHQSYDMICQVVEGMLVGKRHYVIMVATLEATHLVSGTFSLRIATKISIFKISLKFLREFLEDTSSCP